MKGRKILGVSMIMVLSGCAATGAAPDSPKVVKQTMNDFEMLLKPSPAPFMIPEWDKYQIDWYKPAFTLAIEHHKKEIAAIIENSAAPTFANTVVALENSGRELERVASVFYNLFSMNTNDELQKLAQEISPMLSAHEDEISMNEGLFKRLEVLYKSKDTLNLSAADDKLLSDYYEGFIRGGAALGAAEKARLKEINSRLSVATLTFGDHLLAEENNYLYLVEDEKELAGLPQFVIDQAAETAKAKGKSGWAFTLKYPSIQPVLRFADSAKMREALYMAYLNKGNNNNELDNKALAVEIANLRLERAKLLGYPHHADYVLAKNMAKNAAGVYALMDPIWEKAIAAAKVDLAKITALKGSKAEPWDWSYYMEKRRQSELGLNDDEVRSYFELERVRAGAFKLAERLYGVTIVKRDDLPTYHPEAKIFEIKDGDGSTLGILSMDSFPRDSKHGGAWMNDVVAEEIKDGHRVVPVVVNVHNFTPPSGDIPALLSIDEVETLFHEFGHALHAILSEAKYRSQAGTNVPRDFVEMPSQLMENWVLEPEFLKEYAVHYKDGTPIPAELIEKLQAARVFNQGFITTELMAAAYLDMAWHTITEPFTGDPLAFEAQMVEAKGLPLEVGIRYRTPYFRHIFAGGYSAGYYSYLWTQVLDADVYSLFQKEGLFNREVASRLRHEVLEKGGSEPADTLFKNLMGRQADVQAFLKRKGMND